MHLFTLSLHWLHDSQYKEFNPIFSLCLKQETWNGNMAFYLHSYSLDNFPDPCKKSLIIFFLLFQRNVGFVVPLSQ